MERFSIEEANKMESFEEFTPTSSGPTQLQNPERVKYTIPEALTQPGFKVVRQRFAKTKMIDYLRSLNDSEWREKYSRLHDEHRYFDQVCAGAKHHHWWIGGLQDHCCEMIGVALDMFDLYQGDLKGKITRDDIIIAIYLHDFAKIWTYELITDEDRDKNPKKYLAQQLFRSTTGSFNIVDEESKTLLELGRYGIQPTEQQWSAVLFAEGGWADAVWGPNGQTRVAGTIMAHNPLAVMVHIADMYSSQILGGSIA